MNMNGVLLKLIVRYFLVYNVKVNEHHNSYLYQSNHSLQLALMKIRLIRKIQLSQSLCSMIVIIISFFSVDFSFAQFYKVTSSKVKFKSDAPLEIITAESSELNGLLDVKTRQFAFTVNNESFKGFNSQLQQTHFNDNYMETDKYPIISFCGKIIDELDFNREGSYVVRTKGMMNIKGVNREQLIKSVVNIKEGRITINANFSILLDDYSIRIPRIVSQKIAPEISIDFNTIMENKK